MINEQAKFDLDLGTLIRDSVEGSPHRSIVVEYRHCPHCEEKVLIAHPFCEIVSCVRCDERFASKAPGWPVNGEPRAIDWEEAILQISGEMPKVAKMVRQIALQRAGSRR